LIGFTTVQSAAASFGQLDASGGSLTGMDLVAADTAVIHHLDVSSGTLTGLTLVDTENATIGNLVASGGSISGLSSISAARGSFTTLDASGGTLTGLTNITASTASITTLNVPNFNVAGIVTGSIVAATGTVSNLNSTSVTSTNATVSNQLNCNNVSVSGVITTPTGGPIGSPVGSITMYGGFSAPAGWLLCNGTAVSRTTYAGLFNIIDIAFGQGDGSTTFNLPNMINRFPVGSGDSYSTGNTGGNATKTLGTTEIPAHTHDVPQIDITGGAHNHRFEVNIAETANSGEINTTNPKWGSGDQNNTADGPYPGTTTNGDGGHSHTIPGSTTTSVGGGQSFSIMPPFLAINYIIKY